MPHRLSPEAEGELDDIWLYVARGSGNPDTAERFIETITRQFYLLSMSPHMGRRRDDLRPGLRSFAVGEFVVFYRIEHPHVLILHIVRGSRDIQTFFGK